ncbi:MAG: ATP-dependent sacrificial sulfur transferase LarE [Phycisphaerales bacterium]|jgi:pyridinium-3,5-biscarboxylic acid mononucleotide sulfurtransferase|nr:ATP-dependent sacrificial sulfur transferase LarE [Phycisphaerales bacterium]MBT7171802.1 ATP-dependent sacrificial sulfur transferase LarE [Phycisphaerales bacterium]
MTDTADQLEIKLAHCQRLLARAGRVAIGLSGGVDSGVLCAIAAETLGHENVLAVTATGLIHADSETAAARNIAAHLGVELVEVDMTDCAEEDILSNPPDRCYHCKRYIFSQVVEIATRRNVSAVASGTNADDLGDYRPGLVAEKELQILRPFLEANFTKSDIRALAARFDLAALANKASAACLASRIPYHTRLTPEALRRVELAEATLASLGLTPCRCRDHHPVARIELPPELFHKATLLRDMLREKLTDLGYTYITLDLAGLQTGSLNMLLQKDMS